MIDPYSSIVLDLVFCPKISGNYQSQFVLSTTNEPVNEHNVFIPSNYLLIDTCTCSSYW